MPTSPLADTAASAFRHPPRPALAVGTWTAIAVAACVVHLRRWCLGWEPPAEAEGRLLFGGGAFAASLLSAWLVRAELERWFAARTAFAGALVFVLGLVPFDRGWEIGTWSLLAVVGFLVARRSGGSRAARVAVDTRAALEPEIDEIDDGEADAALVTDRTMRTADESGESIRGETLVRFAPGERQAVVHLAFTPAFEQCPEVEAEVEAGRGTAKVTAVRAFGARIEVRRPSAEEAAALRLSWFAWNSAGTASEAA